MSFGINGQILILIEILYLTKLIYSNIYITLNAFNRGIIMKAYKITFRNYVIGSDAMKRTITVKGWIRKCVTLRSLQRDKKLIVSVDKVDIQ